MGGHSDGQAGGARPSTTTWQMPPTEELPISSCGEAFRDLYARGELLDVAIRVTEGADGDAAHLPPGEGQLRAHMCVLAAVSPVLRKMLTGGFKESRTLNEAGMRVITLHEVSAVQVKGLLDWIYLGTTDVRSTHELMMLGKLADVLDVQALHERVRQHALKGLNDDTCAETMQSAHDAGLTEINEECLAYALKRFDAVAKTDGFLALSEDVLALLLASDRLESSSEEAVYEHVLRWMHYTPGSPSPNAIRGTELLRHLRFPLMDGQYLALEIHQKTGASLNNQDCALLKNLTTEAALWQIVPAESKHLFKLQHLSRAVLQPRRGSWRFAGSHIRHVLRGHREEVQALKIWEGKLISGSVDWSMSVWDSQSFSCEARLVRHQGAVCALEVARKRLFSGSVDRTVCVWDMKSWSCLLVLEGHSKSVFVLKALGDWVLSGSDDGSIKVWGLADIERWSNSTVDQSFLPPGAAAAGADGVGGPCLQVATDTKGELVKQALGPPGGNLEAAGGWRGSVKDGVRDGACAAGQSTAPSAEGGDKARQGEQRSVAGSVGKIEALHTLTDHNKAVCALESHGNYIFSGSFDGTIRVWDRATLSCTKILTGHLGGVCTMAVCNGRLVSGSSDIRVWNLETWTLERVLKGHNGGVNELAVADNKLLGGFDDAFIRVWDTSTWEVERVLEGHVGAVYAIALDDARLYSASFDKCIRVWY